MTILITGANRGIGAALLQGYSDRGDKVIGTARSLSKVANPANWIELDVTDSASVTEMGKALGDAPIDLLICNAGAYLDKFETLAGGYPAQMWADSFAVNVTGVFLTIQTLLPNIRAAGGKIAILSSIMASDAMAPGGSYIYRSSKAAVLNLGRNLAADLAPEGIPVGIYHPGWVRTDMGGDGADISVDEARDGLITRFDALSADTTGCFETYDGTTLSF